MSDFTLLGMMNRCIDDQMVPEATQCSVVDSTAANPSLPDLELLFEDLSSVTELQTLTTLQPCSSTTTSVTDTKHQSQEQSKQQPQQLMEVIKQEAPWKSYDAEGYNEMSMYDELPQPGGLKAERVLIKDEVVAGNDCYYPSAPGGGQQQQSADDPMLDDLCTRICYTCRALNIPTNPYTWRPEHVERWLHHTLQHYNLSDQYCQQLALDGTSLCMLTPSDFQRFSPVAGDFIHTELDIWKTAHNLMSTPPTDMTSPGESAVLTDLDSLAPTYYHTTSGLATSLSGIPTSVITYTTTPMRELPMETASPNQVLCQQQQHPRISPAPSIESLSSCSPHTRWTSSPDSSCHDADDRELNMSFAERPMAAPSHGKHTIHLWQFLKELLLQAHHYQDCIRWLDRNKGIFKIEDSCRVARLWGQRKNRPAMNYDKLSRSIRQYYKKGIIKKTTTSKRLVYQFQPQYV